MTISVREDVYPSTHMNACAHPLPIKLIASSAHSAWTSSGFGSLVPQLVVLLRAGLAFLIWSTSIS